MISWKLNVEFANRRQRRCERTRTVATLWLRWPNHNVEPSGFIERPPLKTSRGSSRIKPLHVVPPGFVDFVADVIGDIQDYQVGAEGRPGFERRVNVVLDYHLPTKHSYPHKSNSPILNLDIDRWADVDMDLAGFGFGH